MPTFRLGKVRRLLKDGKAKIVKHHPFTIQLLYDSKTNTQPIEICEDVGYNYIGISAKANLTNMYLLSMIHCRMRKSIMMIVVKCVVHAETDCVTVNRASITASVIKVGSHLLWNIRSS